MIESSTTTRPLHPHPMVFMFLILPFGVMGGYVTVALAYLFAKAGISVAQVAALVAVGVIPHTWKFAWAPLVDSLLTRKTWYLMASVLSAAGLWVTAALPIQASSLPLLTMVVFRVQSGGNLSRHGHRQPDGL